MTITFQLRAITNPISRPAIITARQLAAFRSFARNHGHIVGVFDDDEFEYLAYGFEARVCPWSWATLAPIFDNSEAVISVIEEAQFLGLNIRFWKDDHNCGILMAVSTTPDGCRPMDMSNQCAKTLLDALGKGSSTSGELPSSELSAILNDQPTRRHLKRSRMQTYLDHLDSMAEKHTYPEKHLVWY